MRKAFGIALCACVSLSLAGCAGSSSEAPRESTKQEESTAESQTQEESVPESTKETVVKEMRDISSTELVKEMKIGWNLGNTLDSTSDNLDITDTPASFEIAWGAQYTCQAQIDKVLEAGFNVIRIPVTWQGHIHDDGKYTIEESWLNRVQEVVDYAYNRGAFVILNTHHEDWYCPYYNTEEAAGEELKAIWTQIGERFKDYDEHLIFEGMNEPRQKGTSAEWTGNDEGRQVINNLEKIFVKTIRELGGNNAKRHLMISGYAASSMDVNLKAIEVPEDDDKIIVSVHAYIPYNFALNNGNGAQSEWNNDTRDIDNLMKTINELFISKGTPVIIGEFGAMNRSNESERAQWASYYVSAAKAIGVPCVWWDNHAFTGSGENFGLLVTNGLNFSWKYPELLDAMITAADAK